MHRDDPIEKRKRTVILLQGRVTPWVTSVEKCELSSTPYSELSQISLLGKRSILNDCQHSEYASYINDFPVA